MTTLSFIDLVDFESKFRDEIWWFGGSVLNMIRPKTAPDIRLYTIIHTWFAILEILSVFGKEQQP